MRSLFLILFVGFAALLLFFSCEDFNPFTAGGVVPGFSEVTPTPAPKLLYYTDDITINKINSDGTGKATIYSRATAPEFLRLDAAGDTLYWLEGGSLYSGGTDGTGINPFTPAEPITCFALDFVRNRIYFGVSTVAVSNEVRYTSLTSPALPGTVVDNTEQIPTLMDVASNGDVYWVNTYLAPTRIDYYNGASVQSFYMTDDIVSDAFFRIDQSSDYLYLYYNTTALTAFDLGTGTIEVSTNITGAPFHDLCIDHAVGYLYLTSGSGIIRTDLSGGNPTEAVSGLTAPFGIDILIK